MPLRPQTAERLRHQRLVGSRIRLAREERHYTIVELSERLGYSRSWLSAVEVGDNSIDAYALQRVADELGYPVEWFTNPDYDHRLRHQPRTRLDWEATYPDSPERAKAHFEIDQVVQRLEGERQAPRLEAAEEKADHHAEPSPPRRGRPRKKPSP